MYVSSRPMCANTHRNETGRKRSNMLKAVFLGREGLDSSHLLSSCNFLFSLSLSLFYTISMYCFYDWGWAEI